MVNSTDRIRAHKDFKKIIDFVRAKYLLDGKKPPGTASITKVIAGKIDQEEILRDVIIKF